MPDQTVKKAVAQAYWGGLARQGEEIVQQRSQREGQNMTQQQPEQNPEEAGRRLQA
jgi:hypothetical protein